MSQNNIPVGDPAREAIDSLRGYVYQIYQSALTWTELKDDQFLFLEVAEDFAVVASEALEAVQVKETTGSVTINSNDIVSSIDSFVELQEKNIGLNVTLRHLTTSTIGVEKKREDRVDNSSTLTAWRNLAKTGDLAELRQVLANSKLSKKTKNFIASLDDNDIRVKLLKRVHFDCGALASKFLARQFESRISKLLIERGGVHSQTQACAAKVLLAVLKLSTNPNRDERVVHRNDLEILIEEATHVTLNRAQFEAHSLLMTKALSASVPSAVNLSSAHDVRPSLISETPLPRALANRTTDIRQLQQTLEKFGVCWISGAAGMGKTITARMLARRNEGAWGNVNLRDQSSEQVALTLFELADSLNDFGLQGLLIDDLSWGTDPSVLDGLCHLFFSAQRSDVLLVLSSSDLPTSEFLFRCNLQTDFEHTLLEFTHGEIGEIIETYEVSDARWKKYAHLVSGGGHPQLAMAFIQSMDSSGWNISEFVTLDALLQGNPAIDDVRKRTRERLLSGLPDSSRKLIERLSLKIGGFGRELAIDLGKIEPNVDDAGIILETLIGTWVDHQEGDRFNLSPLLSDFAAKTLDAESRKNIQSAIAESLTKSSTLHVIDLDSAFLTAWSSENEAVLLKICMAILGSSFAELQMLAPHLTILRLLRTDKVAYPPNPFVSYLLRGVQVLLVNQSNEQPDVIHNSLRSFAEEAASGESKQMHALMCMLIYSKVLLQAPKVGLGPRFTEVITELDHLLESETIPEEILKGTREFGKQGVTAIGFLFMNQVLQLTKIEDLRCVFDFLDSATADLRSRLLAAFNHTDFDMNMLVSAAWLREHDEATIDPSTHGSMFAQLENQASLWGETELAVSCRKYRAIISDEYGNDKEEALAILDEGLSKFGQTNSELVRAKAKVYYRSDDHKGSLELSKTLIDGNTPLNEVEKAFLGRDAAISAEQQGDLKTARRYYLYGSKAAKNCDVPDMAVMAVGLLADAALASWHDDDRQTCLSDFVSVLDELEKIKPDDSLRATYCHAVVRHALIWLEQECTGEERLLSDGEKFKILPGCVSNPSPNAKMKNSYIVSIELAWYMLATVENYALLDIGIAADLERRLPKGPLLEGQMLLSKAKMQKALSRLDAKLFVTATQETVSEFAFVQANGGSSHSFDVMNLTYGTYPLATTEQQEQFRGMTEQYVLLYCATCIFKEEVESITEVIQELNGASGLTVRLTLLDRLQREGPVEDFYTGIANNIQTMAGKEPDAAGLSPQQVFELAIQVLQMAKQNGRLKFISREMLPWLVRRCAFVWAYQRFLLRSPSLYEEDSQAALEMDITYPGAKVIEILRTMLPALRIANESEVVKILNNLSG